MLKTMSGLMAAAAAALLTPAGVDAYGAAHVGYTHVGPNGVYHTGETVARGPNGYAAAGRTTAVGAGGGVYRGGTYDAARVGYGGAAVGGYHYDTRYGAVGGAGYNYGYVR